MSMYRIILRSLRRSSSSSTQTLASSQNLLNPPPPLSRTFAFSSAEEAAAERRRRKRRLRIEPPLSALRSSPAVPYHQRNSHLPPGTPESTSSLVGPRLNLHNRVQSLIRADDLDNASALARQAVFSSTRPTVFTCNALISAMYRHRRYNDAAALFQYFFKQSNINPNVVSYNFLILALCDSGKVDTALEVYKEILDTRPFSPSHVTYRNITKGLIDAGRIDEAVNYLREMLNRGCGADSLVFNNLISGFLNLENLNRANEFFDELKERCSVYDGVVTATFMDWFFKRGRDKEAMEYYRSLLDMKFRMVPATCNVLLETLIKHGKTDEAWAMFDNMLDSHTPPTFQGVNSETFSIMVNEHCRIGKVSEAMDVFKRVGKKVGSKPFAMDVAGFNNMIIRYCEHEMMEEAEKIFSELCSKCLNPDVTTYRTLIDAYFKVGRVDDALEKYKKMVEAGLRVIPDYADRWFGILIENGKVAECAPILTKMGEKDPKPDFTTYDVVIRGLCKGNNFDLGIDLIGQMQRYGIVVTTQLKEFLNEAFAKVGRGEELDRMLTMRGHSYDGYWNRTGPSGPHRSHGHGPVPGRVPSDSRYGFQDNSRPSTQAYQSLGPEQGRVSANSGYGVQGNNFINNRPSNQAYGSLSPEQGRVPFGSGYGVEGNNNNRPYSQAYQSQMQGPEPGRDPADYKYGAEENYNRRYSQASQY